MCPCCYFYTSSSNGKATSSFSNGKATSNLDNAQARSAIIRLAEIICQAVNLGKGWAVIQPGPEEYPGICMFPGSTSDRRIVIFEVGGPVFVAMPLNSLQGFNDMKEAGMEETQLRTYRRILNPELCTLASYLRFLAATSQRDGIRPASDPVR